MSDYPMLISNKLHSFRNFSIQRYQKKFYPCHFIRLYAVILPFLHCFFFLSAWNRLDCPICFLSVSVNGLPDNDLIQAGDRLVCYGQYRDFRKFWKAL